MNSFAETVNLPYNEVALRIAFSAGIGLLVGLEREWAQKEIGVRTFAIAGLLGMLTSLMAPTFVVAGLLGVLLLVAFLNVHSLLRNRSLEMTTSICLIVVFFLGALVGQGHNFTAGASAIVMMTLLAWKLELNRFAGALRPEEIRSAVLLGLLSIVIYPLLPDRFVDPWHLINPRQYWVTVVVIAGIGFLNYALLRLYGNRGMYYSALLGGLVNSTAAVAELSTHMVDETLDGRSVAVLLLTNVAMFARNVTLLAIFAPRATASAALPLAGMGVMAAFLAWLGNSRGLSSVAPLNLSSPISLRRVIKFGTLFLLLACAGTLAQRHFGNVGFLVVSIFGGTISSASTTATAAALAAAGNISPATAGIATILTSMSSGTINVPLVYQQTHRWRLTRRLGLSTLLVFAVGGAVLAVLLWQVNLGHLPILKSYGATTRSAQ